MNKRLLIALACGFSLLASPAMAQKRLVAVTIAPFAEIVKRLGGPETDVHVIIRPGQSPHGYEPAPGGVKMIGQAEFIVMAGLGLDNWILKTVRAAGKTVAEDVVDCSLAVPARSLIGEDLRSHDHDDDHGKHVANPHYWLDPVLMIQVAGAIAERLSLSASPTHREEIAARRKSLEQDLEALDAEIRLALKPAKKGFVAYHGAWDYFARRYGLNQAGVMEESPGKSVSAKKFATLVKTISEAGVSTVVAEAQFSPKLAQALADEAGVRVVMADPVGGAPGRDGYFELMRFNTRMFLEGLK